ncbi:hypothetical protein [Mesorhizobium sp. RIZ17]|uniref:hypothetical protein n=1 Tax=Mesorhizobium sp. RIZ17 TaxID=3132743 RepID=UPI003DA9C460
MSPSLEQVIADLQNADHAFRTEYAPHGSALAIQAAMDFMVREGVAPTLMFPLLAVMGDLADSHGESNLKPIMEAMMWGRAAGAVHVLKGSGMSLSEAATKVSKATGRAISANQIIEFRKNIGKRKARQEAVEEYWDMVSRLNKQPAEHRANLALQMTSKIFVEGKKG